MQPSSQDACQLLFSTIIHVRYQQSANKDSPARPAHTLSRKGLSVVLDLDRLTDADKQSSLFSIINLIFSLLMNAIMGQTIHHKNVRNSPKKSRLRTM